MVEAWVTDAQILDDDKALKQIEHSVLLKTSVVEQFLESYHRPSLALVAPKGFGKTFILKLKRLQLDDVTCLPHGTIVSRPITRAPTLSLETMTYLGQSGPWQSVWELAIAVTVIRADSLNKSAEEQRDLESQIRSDPLLELIRRGDIDTPFEVVDFLLRLNRKALIDSLESSGEIISILSRVKRKYALFIDNIDEYVDEYLKARRTLPQVPQINFSNLWNNAQVGAWLAIRQLQGINPHVKVYFSLRKEAYHHAQSHEPLFSNLDDAFSTELRYDPEELIAIIENNIRVEKPSRMAQGDRSDLISAFIGRDALRVVNTGTGTVEHILDYWLRHCVGRPRDAMFIGKKISSIDPQKRTGSKVRGAITSAAASSVEKLFNESRHHIQDFDPKLLARALPSNVLSRAQLELSSKAYEGFLENEGVSAGREDSHVFCMLYSLGLIGILRQDQNEPGRYHQEFPAIGEYPVARTNCLPIADYYFLHPALSDYIIVRDETFVERLHRYNIVGPGRLWREPTDYVFVVVGDMVGYRKAIMNRPGPTASFPEFWKKAFERATSELQLKELSGGDSFLLADRSALRIIEACRSIAAQLAGSEYGISVRVGGHSGFWRLGSAEHKEVAISDIVGVAARIEPHAERNTILVSEQFFKGVEATDNSELISQFSLWGQAVGEDGEVLPTVISKPHEPVEATRLYSLLL